MSNPRKDYSSVVASCAEILDKMMICEQERVKIADALGATISRFLKDQEDPDSFLQRLGRDISIRREKFTDISILRTSYQLHLFLKELPSVTDFTEITLDGFARVNQKVKVPGKQKDSSVQSMLYQIVRLIEKAVRTINAEAVPLSTDDISKINSTIALIEQRISVLRITLSESGKQQLLITCKADD